MKVERSIAEGRPATPSQPVARWSPSTIIVGLLLAAAALVLYAVSNPVHYNQYTHFVWQADAFLHGRAWFPHPIADGSTLPANWWFQDVYPLTDAAGNPDGRVLLPFPPLPAIVLLPFVAVFGLFTDQEAVGMLLAALGVAIAYWMLGRLPVRASVRILTTLVFATGTVWWWAAAVSSTWYFAHLVAVDIALLAVGVSLGADRRAAVEDLGEEVDRAAEDGGGPWAAIWPLDRSQVVAGFLLGVAATARLPLVFAAPWLMLVGGGGSRLRRTVSAGVGGVVPVAALLLYTFATTGSVLHPGYDYQYRLEASGYPTLGYNPEWSVEDPRYVPQNLGIMFGALPLVAPDIKPDTLGFAEPEPLCTAPDARRGLFDPDCPLVMPVDIGTSILLSAPGLLLALFAFGRRPVVRLALGGGLSVIAIALFNLSHFSQGWVQWGYRFSLDFIPFLLPLIAIGAARADGRPRAVAVALVIAGALVNLWGVTWGQLLGW
ncbi:MAG: hypothetical protein AB1627_06760 [Chloroflexota bacterium]